MSFSDDKQADVIDAFNTTSRYLDDISNINLTSVDGTPSQVPAFELIKASAKFEVNTTNGLGGDAFTRKYIISLLTLILGQGQSRNAAQYPLHHMTYAPAKFKAAMFNC